jgi:DNA-binding GntR family transcriptional regulator
MSKERPYADLKRRILTLKLEPNASLDEAAPNAEHGISRTPRPTQRPR